MAGESNPEIAYHETGGIERFVINWVRQGTDDEPIQRLRCFWYLGVLRLKMVAEMDALQELVRIVGFILEVFGVFIVFAGSLASTIWFLLQLRPEGLTHAYQTYRRAFGRSVILGLDFLIAGDIIRTVIVSHTVTSVLVLAIIVLVRAFLSLTLELGVEGRLPWKGSANLS